MLIQKWGVQSSQGFWGSVVNDAATPGPTHSDATERCVVMRTAEFTYRYSDGAFVRARPANADAARPRLDEGNRTFANLLDTLATDDGSARYTIPDVHPEDLGLLSGAALPRQRPFAAVLGCSDARVPVELIFGEGPNDLFVVRVAGNGLAAMYLAVSDTPLNICGAVCGFSLSWQLAGAGGSSAAVDTFLEPAGYLALATNHAIRGILDRQLIRISSDRKAAGERIRVRRDSARALPRGPD